MPISSPASISVLRAIEAPIRQIVENAGVEGSLVVGKILENKSQTFGFNAQTEQYVDMLSAGIVDPAKVVRVALQDAASVAGLLITTEAMVTDRPKKDAPPAIPRWWYGRHGRDGLLTIGTGRQAHNCEPVAAVGLHLTVRRPFGGFQSVS